MSSMTTSARTLILFVGGALLGTGLGVATMVTISSPSRTGVIGEAAASLPTSQSAEPFRDVELF
jgi:hypothetical protein